MAFPGQRMINFFSYAIVVIFASAYLSCSDSNPKIDENTLAVVGDKKIDSEYFLERYQDFRSQTGVQDNGQARRSILKNIINEELFINEARKRDYDSDPEGKHEFERIKIQELLNTYHQEMITSKINVDEGELRKLYIELNTKIKARHLYAPTYEEASALYQELQHGKTFDELAEETFKDPVLRNSGGILGYFTVDEMEPAFEEAAYDLKVGEISKPVRTNDGYSIIKVEDRKVQPLLTESEYAKHRSKLLIYWKKRQSRKLTQQHVESLKQSLNVKFNDQTIQKLFKALNNKGENSTAEQPITSQAINEIKNEELVRSEIGVWDIEEFQKCAIYTSENQHRWIRTEENLKDFISGLVVREYILSEARKRNWDKTSSYKQAVAEDFDNYLLERIENDLYREIVIPEDSLLSYYNQDPQRFADPPEVNLLEIVLKNASDTTMITAELKKGISFSKLAKQYSARRWSAEKGGDLGYLTPQDLGRWADVAFSMPVGKWTGPLKMDQYFVFLACINKIPAKIRTFQQARSDVEEAFRTMWWEQEKREKLNEIRQSTYARSFPEKLMTIRAN